MDFHLGIEFKVGKSFAFLKEINQSILDDQVVDLTNIDDFIFNALNLRAANGLSLIDNLTNDDFLVNRVENNSKPIFFAGKSLPVFNKFIKESYYIDTNIDTDDDGFSDRVLVQVTRPDTTNKVPVLLCADPYFEGTNEMEQNLNTIEGNLKEKSVTEFKTQKISNYPTAPAKIIKDGIKKPEHRSENQESNNIPLNDFFIPRGFAVAYVAGLGTRNSDGMRTTGDRAETLTYSKAVEFLSGNEKGFYTRYGEEKVTIQWTNGSVAMTGRSYLGTLLPLLQLKIPVG